MTNIQLWLSIGIPTLAILVGMLMNMVQVTTLNARLNDINARIQSLENRLDARISGLETKVDLLMQKFFELDTRMSRLEDRIH